MSARLRKKEHDRRILGRLNSIQLRGRSTEEPRVHAWRALKPDIMRVFRNSRASAWDWFISPAIALDNESPMELAIAGNLQLVRDYLTKLEYGVYI